MKLQVDDFNVRMEWQNMFSKIRVDLQWSGQISKRLDGIVQLRLPFDDLFTPLKSILKKISLAAVYRISEWTTTLHVGEILALAPITFAPRGNRICYVIPVGAYERDQKNKRVKWDSIHMYVRMIRFDMLLTIR